MRKVPFDTFGTQTSTHTNYKIIYHFFLYYVLTCKNSKNETYFNSIQRTWCISWYMLFKLHLTLLHLHPVYFKTLQRPVKKNVMLKYMLLRFNSINNYYSFKDLFYLQKGWYILVTNKNYLIIRLLCSISSMKYLKYN